MGTGWNLWFRSVGSGLIAILNRIVVRASQILIMNQTKAAAREISTYAPRPRCCPRCPLHIMIHPTSVDRVNNPTTKLVFCIAISTFPARSSPNWRIAPGSTNSFFPAWKFKSSLPYADRYLTCLPSRSARPSGVWYTLFLVVVPMKLLKTSRISNK